MKRRIFYEEKDRNEIFKLLEIVMNDANGGHADYAKTYAKHAFKAFYEYGDDGLQTQIAYVLSNLQSWRGDLARSTKAGLRKHNRS